MRKIATDRRGLLGVALGAVLLSAAPLSLRLSPATAPSLSFDTAQARIGQPLSPGSIAGVNRRVHRRTARRAYYGGAVAGAAAASYGVAGVGGGYDTGHSPYYGGGYNNLYNYAPSANAAAPAANAAPAASAAPAANAVPVTNTASTSEGSSTPLAPELYAACLNRTYGACPGQ